MSSFRLPPEVLRKVVECACAEPMLVSRESRAGQTRQQNLPSFCLVNSSWKPVAQRLLWQVLNFTLEEEGRSWLRSEITEMQSYITRSLSLVHYSGAHDQTRDTSLTEETGLWIVERCKGLKYLEVATEGWTGSLLYSPSLRGEAACILIC